MVILLAKKLAAVMVVRRVPSLELRKAARLVTSAVAKKVAG